MLELHGDPRFMLPVVIRIGRYLLDYKFESCPGRFYRR